MEPELISTVHSYGAGKFHRLRLIAHLQGKDSVRQILQFTRGLPRIVRNRHTIQSTEIHPGERKGVQRLLNKRGNFLLDLL